MNMRSYVFGAACLSLGLLGCGKHDAPAPTPANAPGLVMLDKPLTPIQSKDGQGSAPKSRPRDIPPGYKKSSQGEPGTYDPLNNFMVDWSDNLHAIDPTKPVTNPPPLASADWKDTTGISAQEIAANVDAAFKKLAGVNSYMNVHLILPIGEGTVKCNSGYYKPGQFYVQYPIIEGNPPHPQQVETRVSGGQMVEFHPDRGNQNAFSPVQPFTPGGAMDGQQLLKEWPTEMPRLALSHFLVGKDAFTPLVAALSDKNSGYQVFCQERATEFHGRRFLDYRILAERPADEAKKLPAVQFEIVVDQQHWVPVTMRSRMSPGHAQKSTTIEWTASWGKMDKYIPQEYAMPGQRV